MKKAIFSILLSLGSLLFAQVTVGVLNGPSCIPAANMMEEVVSIQGERLYFEQYSDATSLLPKLIRNEVEIGFLPVNVAAKLYNASNSYIVCSAVTGMGNIVLITKDKSIKKLSDLTGKTIYVAGHGATPDYMFRYLLNKNGIFITEENTENSVVLDYSIPTNQLAAQIISGKIEYAVVPEPFATVAQLKSSDVEYAIDFQKEYKQITKRENYPLTVMVVNKKFAQEKTEVLNSFLEEYKNSYEKTLENPRNAAALVEKFGLGLNAQVVLNSLPKANYVFIPAQQGKDDIISLLQIFLEAEETSIGGKLPDNEFYY